MSIIPEFNVQSKFQFIDAPLQQGPNHCATCGRYDNVTDPAHYKPLKFCDPNFELEFYGKLFLCVDCIKEMAMQLGMVLPERVLPVEEALLRLSEEHVEVLNENSRLQGELSAFSSFVNSGDRSLLPADSAVSSSTEGAVKGSTGGPEVKDKSDHKSDATNTGAVEPSTGKGPADLFDFSRLDDEFADDI